MLGGRAPVYAVLPGAAVAALLAIVAPSIEAAPAQAQAPAAAAGASARAVLDKYCVGCHSDRLKTGGLTLQGADVTTVPAGAETWERVIRKLRTGSMPPAGAPRPDAVDHRRNGRLLRDGDRPRVGRSADAGENRAAPSPEPGGVPERGARRARPDRGRHRAHTGRRSELRIRQHRRRAQDVADAARALHGRRARHQPAGRRRVGVAAHGGDVQAPVGPVAVRACRRAAVRHTRRARPFRTTSRATASTRSRSNCSTCSPAPR